MHVITRKRLNEFAEKHPEAKSALARWYAIMRKSPANRDDSCQHIEIPRRIELGRPPEAGVSDWRKRVQMSWRRFSKICVERPIELFEQLNSSIAEVVEDVASQLDTERCL